MAIAQIYPKQYSYPENEDPITIIFENLLLAMFTSFNICVTEAILERNLRNLFTNLNFEIPQDLNNHIRESLPFLVTNRYLKENNDGYVLTNEGAIIGKKALKNFRQFVHKYLYS